jgi:hypothetical protein
MGAAAPVRATTPNRPPDGAGARRGLHLRRGGPSLTPLPRRQAELAGTDGADGDLAGHAGGYACRRA